MKTLTKSILLLLALLVVLLAVGIFFSLQSTPTTQANNLMNAHTAKQSKQAIARVVQSFASQQESTQVSLSAQELKSISALANRSVPQLTTDVNLQPSVAIAFLSYELPIAVDFRYLNINVTLYGSSNGLSLGNIDVGALSIPGTWLQAGLKWALNHFAHPELGDKIFSAIEWIKITPHKIRFNVKLPADLKKLDDGGKSTLIALRDKLALFGNVEKIKTYHQHLANSLANDHPPELTRLINDLFTLVEKNSNTLTATEQAAENRVALTALVIYLGTDKFELLVGDINNLSREQQNKRDKLRTSLTLHNRVDLQKHFIYSIALQLFSSQSASDAIGEMKEFIDSNKGGSGFSFVDLLADRAGTKLAKQATNVEQARLIQQRLSQLSHESELIPDITALSEGLSQQEFEQDYQNIHSSQYKSTLNIIDNRIEKLALYQQ